MVKQRKFHNCGQNGRKVDKTANMAGMVEVFVGSSAVPKGLLKPSQNFYTAHHALRNLFEA